MSNLFKCHSREVFHIEDVKAYSGIVKIGSCWGKLTLKDKEECVVGDGSYYNDGRHISHICFNFIRFIEWIEKDEKEIYQRGHLYDGSVLFED